MSDSRAVRREGSDQTASADNDRIATETQDQCSCCGYFSLLDDTTRWMLSEFKRMLNDALPILSVREFFRCKHMLAEDSDEYLAYKRIIDLFNKSALEQGHLKIANVPNGVILTWQ
jgi:hypothetical protein